HAPGGSRDVDARSRGAPRAAPLGGDADVHGDESARPAARPAPATDDEVLRKRDFADCTIEELAQLRRIVTAMQVAPPMRASRRHRRHHLGRAVDRRDTMRHARRTGGQPFELRMRRPTARRRRVVLIADVSGSMEAYSRAYLYLLHGAVKALRAETFVFATRLTRLTRRLRVSTADPEFVLRTAVAEVEDWAGGTRIGESLRTFNDQWGRRGLARGAVVVIVSDGWESGDAAVLGEQMARLRRMAHRVIWVNPRAKGADYQPLVGGMAAALPFVDTFASGHSLAALDDVIRAISVTARPSR
ncbi:MAG TPA: VWA domain-containing protein, partial [Ilumatobacteraceae bacterium]|nr:VWA domain-containing protein [Ilumatobacteraceae bacterium]